MPEPGRAKLDAFDASLRRGTRMRWPSGEVLGPDDRIEFDPAAGDLLELRHAPSRRFIGREPVHESLLIELVDPLTGGPPSALTLGRVAYRAGTERLAYQATRAVGSLVLVEATAERFVLDAALTLIDPELDVDQAGPHQLAGTIVIDR